MTTISSLDITEQLSSNSNDPRISTVILSYNRVHLLELTVKSYLATVSVPYELVIIDNASSDGSREFIRDICESDPRHKAILLDENLGGEAINIALQSARGLFLHISENDIEYLPEWDVELLSKFDVFPELGQLSLFAQEKQSLTKAVTRGNCTIYVAEMNVITPSILRREVWDRGMRWRSIRVKNIGKLKLPADAAASESVKKLGYWVAWNDKDTAINWGFRPEEWLKHPQYYLESWQARPKLHDIMLKRFHSIGIDLVKDDNGKYKIVKR